MAGQTLSVCSYNIHKGFSQLNLRMVIHELREQLRGLDPDISLLQEVQGEHLKHAGAVDQAARNTFVVENFYDFVLLELCIFSTARFLRTKPVTFFDLFRT